jgi:PAS domain-containing protein
MLNYNIYLFVIGTSIGFILLNTDTGNLKKLYQFVAFTFFTFALAYFVRIIAHLMVPDYNHFLQSRVYNYFPVILQILLDIIWTISLMLIYIEMARQKERQSEERYKTLSNLTFEGILIHNDGIVVDVNLALCKILGYQPEELVGTNIIYKAVLNNDIPKVRKMLLEKSTKAYEVSGMRKNGEIFPA